MMSLRLFLNLQDESIVDRISILVFFHRRCLVQSDYSLPDSKSWGKEGYLDTF
jgi:hypothetical protein